MTELAVLEFRVSANAISIDPSKMQAVLDWPAPETRKDLERFIGLVSYLRANIPRASELLDPLDGAKCSPDCEKIIKEPSFLLQLQRVKQAIASAIARKPIVPNRRFIVATDASGTGIGVALFQGDDLDGANVVALYSRRFRPHEVGYTTHKKEFLAVIAALRKFRQYLWGRHFLLCTDHQALQAIQASNSSHPTIISWLDDLLQFSFDIVHIPASANFLADSLSRYPTEREKPLLVLNLKPQQRESTREKVARVHSHAHQAAGSLFREMTLRHRVSESSGTVG